MIKKTFLTSILLVFILTTIGCSPKNQTSEISSAETVTESVDSGEELSNDITYDSETDTYFFGMGDRGLSQTEVLSYRYLEDHTLIVTARLYAQDDDSTICSGTFYFKRNKYASGVIEPLFYYTVTDAEFTMP